FWPSKNQWKSRRRTTKFPGMLCSEEPWWVSAPFPWRFPWARVISNGCLSYSLLEPIPFPCLADLLARMLGPLTPPARLTPLSEVRDDVCTHRLLWAIGLNSWLAFQCDDIVVDQCPCTLPLQR